MAVIQCDTWWSRFAGNSRMSVRYPAQFGISETEHYLLFLCSSAAYPDEFYWSVYREIRKDEFQIIL